MTFEQWLQARDIDCQSLTAELERSMRSQYDDEQRRLAPVTQILVVPVDDCQWPARGYWVSTGN